MAHNEKNAMSHSPINEPASYRIILHYFTIITGQFARFATL